MEVRLNPSRGCRVLRLLLLSTAAQIATIARRRERHQTWLSAHLGLLLILLILYWHGKLPGAIIVETCCGVVIFVLNGCFILDIFFLVSAAVHKTVDWTFMVLGRLSL